MAIPGLDAPHKDAFGCWVVGYCYYGMLSDNGYHAYDERTRQTVLVKPVARWAFEHITPNTREAAEELAAQHERITSLVAEHDPSVPKQSGAGFGALGLLVEVWGHDTAGIPQARLRATKGEDGVWTISEYDWNRWSVTL